jgi:hypothetical protein
VAAARGRKHQGGVGGGGAHATPLSQRDTPPCPLRAAAVECGKGGRGRAAPIRMIMAAAAATGADMAAVDMRAQGGLMDHVFLRVGALATLRAMKLGSVTGCMVTASHNDEPDNGVKICEAGGDMMAESWEGYASELANLKGEQSSSSGSSSACMHERTASERREHGRCSAGGGPIGAVQCWRVVAAAAAAAANQMGNEWGGKPTRARGGGG